MCICARRGSFGERERREGDLVIKIERQMIKDRHRWRKCYEEIDKRTRKGGIRRQRGMPVYVYERK